MTSSTLAQKTEITHNPPASTMKALVYRTSGKGAGEVSWEDHPRPAIQHAEDAIVRITMTTICGTDLHIVKGDLPTVTDGRILGHEGLGVVEEIGSGVTSFAVGDKVILSCVTACMKCDFCRKGMLSHCRNGGWILGNLIDGTQAEYVRIPYADGSLYRFPEGADDHAMVMLSDALPTGFECGVLNGKIKPGDTIAIVGAGAVGLAILLTAQFYSPAAIFMVDLDGHRLAVAQEFGATTTVNSSDGKAIQTILQLTGGQGVDVAIEAVGIPATFDICQGILAAGGHLANVGVHGKPVSLHLPELWDRNIALTTRLVDTVTIPMLLKVVLSGKVEPARLITHRFFLEDILKAYDIYGNAARERALKVVLVNR